LADTCSVSLEDSCHICRISLCDRSENISKNTEDIIILELVIFKVILSIHV